MDGRRGFECKVLACHLENSMDVRGHTRAVETAERRSLDELWTSIDWEHIMVGMERVEEAHKVDVRTKARGKMELR